MNKALAGTGLFVSFLLLGGLWVGLLRFLPAGVPRSAVVIALGILLVAVYVGLLVSHIRRILGGTEHFAVQGLLVLLELSLLLLGFASMYESLGIIDTTRPGSPVVNDLLLSLYFSVITFTTVGYGDFYPTGLGRALAALQGLSGYMVLGVLASTVASVLSPHNPAGPAGEDGDGDDG